MTGGQGEELIGRTIAGRYELRAVLGRGGMATVYRAYQGALDREVAVKLIDPRREQDREFVERFRLEARIVARLRHRNILTIYDFGEEFGVPFLVTELITGGTLHARLDEPRSPAQALDIVAQVGQALDYAHSQGIVHRDVKPANVFLERDQAILADFGIAKVLGGATDAGLTATGAGIGTPEYMAPEQLLGEPIDGRADLYALAVLTYRLLAGRLPFQREGREETLMGLVLRKINNQPPPPSSFNPRLPAAFDAAMHRALARQPQERYATAADFVAATRLALGISGEVPIVAPETREAATQVPTARPPAPPTVTAPPVSPYETQLATAPPFWSQPTAPLPPPSAPPTYPPAYTPPVPPARRSPANQRGMALIFGAIGLLGLLVVAAAAGAFVLTRNGGPTPTPTVARVTVTPNPPTITAIAQAGAKTAATPPTATPAPTATPTTIVTATPTAASPTAQPATVVPDTNPGPSPTATPAPPPTATPAPPPTAAPQPTPPPTATPIPPPPPSAPPPAGAAAVARQSILSLPGTSSGVYASLTNPSDTASDDPDRVMPAASLIKLPLAGAAYQQVAAGQWRLTDTFTLTQANKTGGTGIIQNQPIGSAYTLDQLIEIMLVYSDNTAANMLIDRLGGFDKVNAFAAANGMGSTTMRRKLFDLAAQQRGIDNTTTAGDIARYFLRLQAGQIVNATFSDRLRTILIRRGQEDRNWALLNLPGTVIAAHMTGTGTGVRNDAILVTAGDQQYLLVLLVQDTNEAGIEQAIARVSAEVYRAVVGR